MRKEHPYTQDDPFDSLKQNERDKNPPQKETNTHAKNANNDSSPFEIPQKQDTD